MRKIKRYGNRKFYDAAAKRYVTLSDIADIVRSGEEVQVIDHATGRDITAQVMVQILTKASRSTPLPLSLLTAMVRGSEGILLDAVGASVEKVLKRLGLPTQEDIERLREAVDELEERVQKLQE